MRQETIEIPAGETLERVLTDVGDIELHFNQRTNSTLRLHTLNFTAANQSIWVEQEGEKCVTEVYGLTFLQNSENVRINTRIHHNIGGGKSVQLIKYILGGTAKGEFFGELKIAKDAQQTEAQQTNRNILLTDTATMRTRPQLEIYANDVKAGHGATTGQLDESALFYMQQRGLSKEQGRQMLLQAFMADVIDSISNENTRDFALSLLESKMSK